MEDVVGGEKKKSLTQSAGEIGRYRGEARQTSCPQITGLNLQTTTLFPNAFL